MTADVRRIGGGDEDISAAVARVLEAKSVAIVGVSSALGSVGLSVLENLQSFQFDGEIHLVSRSRKDVHGIPCVSNVDDLPYGLDVAVLCVPASIIHETVAACARRGVHAVLLFGAGYAETGDEGKELQQKLVREARASNMLILGPNCMGLTNFRDSIPLTFASGIKASAVEGRSLSILTQSGGMMSNLREICQARRVSISYAISTGNEAMIGVEDFLGCLLDDASTAAVMLYVEQIRHPEKFLHMARKARMLKKPLVLLHPGRSAAAREAAQSHTGSVAGDTQVIQTLLEAEAVVTVETIEEFVDVAWLLTWFQNFVTGGIGMVTDSGALKSFALDYAECLRLQLPSLLPHTCSQLDSVLPRYTRASNPLDITAQALTEMNLYSDSVRMMARDPNINYLLVVVLPGSQETGLKKCRSILQAISELDKPVLYVVVGEGTTLAEELYKSLYDNRIPLFRTIERAMRAMVGVSRYVELLHRAEVIERSSGLRVEIYPKEKGGSGTSQSPLLQIKQSGTCMEYQSKLIISDLGIPVPKGMMCNTVEQALAYAEQIHYPVVLKAQGSQLAHKTEVGGVITGIGDSIQLRDAWFQIENQVRVKRPDVVMEGLLVEEMCRPGIEMVVGGRRHDQWGPVLMVGLGGVWIEVLKDIRLLPPNLDADSVEREILKLRAAPLLQGIRGASPLDVKAISRAVTALGTCMIQNPNVSEIEINPLVVYAEKEGVVALDSLLVTKEV